LTGGSCGIMCEADDGNRPRMASWEDRAVIKILTGQMLTVGVSDLPAAHRLARAAGPQLTIEERGDPGAAPRGRRTPSPGEQTEVHREGDLRALEGPPGRAPASSNRSASARDSSPRAAFGASVWHSSHHRSLVAASTRDPGVTPGLFTGPSEAD